MKIYSNEIHKQVHKPSHYRPVETKFPYETLTCDLIDMNMYIKNNDGYRYILLIEDIFSRYAWAVPMKRKNETYDEFVKIFGKNNDKVIAKIWCDEGTEFYNKKFTQWCKKNNVTMYSTYGGKYKNSMIERLVRTIKLLVDKRLTEKSTYRWIDIIDDVMNEYNNRKHTAIGITPSEGLKKIKQEELKSLRGKEIPEQKPKFQVGDVVRIARLKPIFEKANYNFSTELFKITKVKTKQPPTYEISEWNGTPIKGSFYESELLKTKLDDIFLIDKVIKTRKRNGKKECLVHWLGWSSDYDEWKPEKEIINL